MWRKTINQQNYFDKILSFLSSEENERFYIIFPSGEQHPVERKIDLIERSLIKMKESKSKLIIERCQNKKINKELEFSRSDLSRKDHLIQKLRNEIAELNNDLKIIESTLPTDEVYIKRRLATIDALEVGGVDNWEWYGDSLKAAGIEDD